jgi:hypothetical protein
VTKNRKTVEMRVLKVTLNEEEWDAKSSELARVVMEERDQEDAIDRQTEDAKAVKKALEGRLAGIRGNRNALATAVATRQVDRDVPCDWFYHLDGGKAVLVRRDTNEAVESRDLKPEERQLAIGEKLAEATAGQIELWENQIREAKAVEVAPEQAEPEQEAGEAAEA